MHRVLLLLDDEKKVLSSLNRLLRDEGYKIVQSTDADDAFEKIKMFKPSVIMSDQRMPNMTGVEFLIKVKEFFPDTVRMVLSGQADINDVRDAINKGAIYKFLAKPWDPAELKSTIQEAFMHADLLEEKKQIMNDVRQANAQLNIINQSLYKKLDDKSQELITISQYDELTGLPNRLLFVDRLNQAIKKSTDQDNKTAVIIIGLERFSVINEAYGHQGGNEVLVEYAKALRNTLRDDATLARLGPTKFSIMLTDVSAINYLEELINRISNIDSVNCFISSHKTYLTTSVGISIFPYDSTNAEMLIKNADTAMHYARDNNGSQYKYYDSDMNRVASERMLLESELRKATEQNEFVLYYQPQIRISGQKLVGAESLIRWNHPVRGLIPPAVFIPTLEETGLIEQVGEWIILESFKLAKNCMSDGVDLKRLSINLSARQFYNKNLLNFIKRALHDIQFDPAQFCIEFEITESMIVKDMDYTIHFLNELANMGFIIAMDDFGTGYASLSYLTRLPIHTLKIDLSFIQRMIKHKNDANIVKAIIAMAHSLDMNVIAEGVETKDELTLLEKYGCDETQGYYFGKPMPVADFLKLIKQ